jgi:hypothetical protein
MITSGIALVVSAQALAAPLAAIADHQSFEAYVQAALLEAAEGHPDAVFPVIVQASEGTSTAGMAEEVTRRLDDNSSSADRLTGRFQSVTGVSARLTGDQILDLAGEGDVQAITRDAPMVSAGLRSVRENLSGLLGWLDTTGLGEARRNAHGALPTIAFVDSGIDSTRREFDNRIVGQVSLTQLQPNGTGDGRGHGTFVAGLAAGSFGGAPAARIVSLDVIDDNGKGMTSDVIAAADWILQNKDRYGIRVANFSLHSSRASSFRTDPLDRAVERLWFAGVVVVTSAGNYAENGAASGLPFAPANDPFVITVGASDTGTSSSADDDSNAPWSAYGRTPDGFRKPDLGAPGRQLVGPVPKGATPLEEPRTAASSPVTCGSPAPRSRPPWSRRPRPTCSRLTRAGRRIRSRAPSWSRPGRLARPHRAPSASGRWTREARSASPSRRTRTSRSTGSSSPTLPEARTPSSTRPAGTAPPRQTSPGTQPPGRTPPGQTRPGTRRPGPT